MRAIALLFVLLTLGLPACSPAPVETVPQQASFAATLESAAGHFVVRARTEDNTPLPVGRFHNWILEVADRDGAGIFPAQIAVAGGMPQHQHGMPTEPSVSAHLGDGQYLLEGMKFHMDGEWVIRVFVATEDWQDVAETTLAVRY